MFTVYITMSNGHLNIFDNQNFEELEGLRKKYAHTADSIEIISSEDLSEVSLGLSMGYL